MEFDAGLGYIWACLNQSLWSLEWFVCVLCDSELRSIVFWLTNSLHRSFPFQNGEVLETRGGLSSTSCTLEQWSLLCLFYWWQCFSCWVNTLSCSFSFEGFFFQFVCMDVLLACLHCECVVLIEARRVWSRTGVLGVFEPPCQYWNWTLVLGKHRVLLTAESSL